MSFLGLFKASDKNEDPKKAPPTEGSDEEKQDFDPAKALIRIALFATGAAVVLIVFGAFAADKSKQIGVGLITAGGAAVVGALLGFIFGVPFSREITSNNQSDSDNKKGLKPNAPRYRPNTSLEQISEWLSKMLVGVGLVELKNLSVQLYRLAKFVSSGLGDDDAATVVAYFGILLFAGCGFLFGFLWARIYLPRWFTKADEDLATKAMDTARGAETKAENAEVVANQAKDMLVSAWIARDIVEKIEKYKESKQPIPEDLHTEAESVRANLDDYRRTFPTTRILFVVLGNLTFGLDHADEALAALQEFIENRNKAKDSGDPADVAAAWYNMACFYAILSTGDQESMGYSKKETAEVLHNKSLGALEVCLEVSKECGSKQLDQRLAKTKTDPDLKALEGSDRFRKLIQRYEKNQKS